MPGFTSEPPPFAQNAVGLNSVPLLPRPASPPAPRGTDLCRPYPSRLDILFLGLFHIRRIFNPILNPYQVHILRAVPALLCVKGAGHANKNPRVKSTPGVHIIPSVQGRYQAACKPQPAFQGEPCTLHIKSWHSSSHPVNPLVRPHLFQGPDTSTGLSQRPLWICCYGESC